MTHQVKEQLLSAGQTLMLNQGYNATTIQQICEKAKTTKGSFFHYFKNKEDYGKAVALNYWEESKAYILSAPFHQLKDPLQRVFGWIDLFDTPDADPNTSCLLGNLSQEIFQTFPSIREMCAVCFREFSSLIKKDLDAAKVKYGMTEEADTQELADYFVALSEGALLMSKAHQDAKIGQMALRHFKRYIALLFYTSSKT